MPRYSHSKIETYRTCPKKYEFGYVQKLPRAVQGIEAFMGSRVHEALEHLYESVGLCRLPDAEEIVEWYQEAWEREWDDSVRIVRRDRTAEDYRAVGEKAIRDFYARHHPFAQVHPPGAED